MVISQWNVNGWTTANADLRTKLLQHACGNSDIIAISETHCKNNADNQPHLDGFTWYGHCRSSQHVRAHRRHGGVGIFVKQSCYTCYKITVIDRSYDGILCLLFEHKQSDFKFLVFSCYLPPEDSPWGRDNTAFYGHLLSQIYFHNYVDCFFVCGDLNSRTGGLTDYIHGVDDIQPRVCIDLVKNSHGECLIDFLLESKSCIVNGRVTPQYDSFTCKGSSVVDYFAVPQESLKNCIKCEVMCTTDLINDLNLQGLIGTGCRPPDHAVMSLTCRLSAYDHCDENECHTDGVYNNVTGADTTGTPAARPKRRYQHEHTDPAFLSTPLWGHVCAELISKIHNLEATQKQFNDAYVELCDAVFKEMDEFIRYKDHGKSVRKKFKNYKPYWSDELTALWRDMAAAEKSYRKCPFNSSLRPSLRDHFKQKRAIFDKELRKAERAYNRSFADKIEDINTSDPKAFWEHIQRLGPQKTSEIPLKVHDGSDGFSEDLNVVLGTWRSDFESLYNIPDGDNDVFNEQCLGDILAEKNRLETQSASFESADFNEPFTIEELDKVCQRLKNGKALGPDMLPNEVLKNEGIRPLLHAFVNKCFELHLVPEVWQQAIISPIPKSASKDPYVPLNYRGISLLSCFYKLYSALLNNRVSKHCEDNNLIVDEQNGFRTDRSCLDHIYSLSTIIRNRLTENMPTYCAFIDMKKAFDWVNRDLLCYKLMAQFGIFGRLYEAIKSVYSNSKACVKVNMHSTEWFNIYAGVKQGDTLSPTLFSMYINDLATSVKELNCGIDIDGHNVSILLSADDLVLIARDEQHLQLMLDKVAEWCHKWRMIVNTDKTQVVHFRSRRSRLTQFEFMFNGISLEKVSVYKYLGVYFDEHLSFKNTTSALAESASRALGSVRYKLRFLKECRCATFTKLFTSCICPIMEYGAGVWGTKSFEVLEQIQRKAMRYFLGVHRFAPSDFLVGDFGWETCFTRQKLAILRLWNRLVCMHTDRVTSKIFLWDLNYSAVPGSWSNSAFNIVCEVSTPLSFHELVPYDIGKALASLRIREAVSWNFSRYNKPKLRYYNMYKGDISQEEYLNYAIPKYHRSLFAQFRAGILPLQVEIGRYRNLPLTERVCTLCPLGDVEDEFHLLCKCHRYAALRVPMFEKAAQENNDFHALDELDKFVYLINSCQRAVIKFLVEALSIRRQALFSN